MTRNKFGARRLVRALAHGFALSFAVAAPLAHASHIGESLTLDQQLITSNDQLLGALAQWQKLSGPLRAAGVANLVQLAQHRQEHMILLLQSNPTVAGARMMPASLRAKLPPQAAVWVEQEVHVQGNVFAHVADDFAAGRSKSTFKIQGRGDPNALNIYLADPTGSERDLHRMSGKQASFVAMRIGNNLVLLDKKTVQLQAAASTSTTSSTSTLVATTTVVQGDQKTLSILLNFNDAAISCTANDVANRLFGTTAGAATVNNNYQQSSRGLVSFSGQAVGPYAIPYSSTGTCDYAGWATAANTAAKAAGFDPATYTRVNYVTPRNSNCGWSGLAYMPGQQSWVQSCTATGVFSHELGHNIALHHAATPTSEYGDYSDPMGAASVVDHNGANRTMAGWMPAGSVQDVGIGGSYPLASISTNAAATSPQVLRIVKPDTSEYYYISLRQALNLDSGLSTQYVNNISVHRATGTLPTKTYLLQSVGAGQSFVDSVNGLTVTNQGVAGGLATVGITFNGGSCVRSAPLVSVSPTSQTAGPGVAVNYSVNVTNTNTAYCGSSTFNVGQGMPTGFSGSVSAPSLSIAPGASASAGWSVTSATTSLPATYTVTATATDATNGSAGFNHASVIVYTDATAPTVSISSPLAGSIVSAGRIALAASVSDNTAVKSVEFYVGTALIATDTSAPYTATWNARRATPGAYSITVKAYDAAGNVGQQAISVNLQ